MRAFNVELNMYLETNSIIAISAVVIALCSLFITIWQLHINRNHNRLSVKPHLFIDVDISHEDPIKLILKNGGVGPAFIKNYRLFVDNKEITSSREQLYNDTIKKVGLDGYSYGFFLLSIKQAFLPDSKTDLFVFSNEGLENDDVENIRENLERIKFIIEYESIYKESFTL
jgi:hypothetical protein